MSRPVLPSSDLKYASDVQRRSGRVRQHDDAAATLRDLWDVTAGSLLQIHGSGALTVLTLYTAFAHSLSIRPVIYIAAAAGTLFPPDAAECGVQLERLLVARPRDEVQTGAMIDAFLRSGLVDLVLVDIPDDYRFDIAHLFRFAHVCRHTGAHLSLFSAANRGLLASSIATRIEARFEEAQPGDHVRLRFLRSRTSQRDVVIPLYDRLR